MHLFFSVGEPSGDQHAAALINELRAREPSLRVSGFGGPQMQQAGQEQLHPLTNLAVMGIGQVLPLLWTFFRLVRRAGWFFREQRPDVVVLVDFPGFNWWIARQAKKAGIPVLYYLPPQLWAWAPWRIGKVRRFVDRILSGLSFEVDWYRRRGVDVEFVGHPFFDEVARHELDAAFLQSLRRDDVRTVGVLPGSRVQEVERNWPVMLEVIRRLHEQHPDVQFRVPLYKESFRELCAEMMYSDDDRLPIDFFVGRTSEIIEAADCCLMVSGSVSLEMLARRTPAVVLYRAPLLMVVFCKLLITCRYMSLPNLMAGRELMPEFPFVAGADRRAGEMAAILDRWLRSPSELADTRRTLDELGAQVAQPGGIEQAASAILRQTEPAVQRWAA